MKTVEFTFDSMLGATYEIEFVVPYGNTTYKADSDGYRSEDGAEFIAYSDIDTVVRSFVGIVFVYNDSGNMIISLKCDKDKIRIEI